MIRSQSFCSVTNGWGLFCKCIILTLQKWCVCSEVHVYCFRIEAAFVFHWSFKKALHNLKPYVLPRDASFLWLQSLNSRTFCWRWTHNGMSTSAAVLCFTWALVLVERGTGWAAERMAFIHWAPSPWFSQGIHNHSKEGFLSSSKFEATVLWAKQVAKLKPPGLRFEAQMAAMWRRFLAQSHEQNRMKLMGWRFPYHWKTYFTSIFSYEYVLASEPLWSFLLVHHSDCMCVILWTLELNTNLNIATKMSHLVMDTSKLVKTSQTRLNEVEFQMKSLGSISQKV